MGLLRPQRGNPRQADPFPALRADVCRDQPDEFRPHRCHRFPLRSAMTRVERAAHVDRRLAELYPETPIPLDHRDAYTLLVAVLLSAQCTDARVNTVTPALFALADTPEEMAKVPVE